MVKVFVSAAWNHAELCSKKDDFVNVLVAIDDSDAARKSVEFAARLVSGRKPGNDQITLLHVVECLPALAIIQEMKQGNYDTVVIGRRGTSARVESFLGGVAEKVAREAYGRTLCIVDV